MLSGTVSAAGAVPSGSVENEDGVGAWRDGVADHGQVRVHGFGVGRSHDQRGADGARSQNRTEQIGPIVAMIARGGRAAAAPRPVLGQGALLADPRFVLEPNLDRLGAPRFGQRRSYQHRDVSLNAACVSASGRADARVATVDGSRAESIR